MPLNESTELPSARQLSNFLEAIPRWSPSSWFPPSLSLSYASLLVSILLFVFVRIDPLRQALFRFPEGPAPWSHYYLALPLISSGILFLIIWRTEDRPSPVFARYWPAALLIACLITTVMAWRDKSDRGDPRIHLAIAVTLLSSLALLPRLLKVFPDSIWVEWAGIAAFLVVWLFGSCATYFISRQMIDYEVRRVEGAAERLETKAREISRLAQEGANLGNVSIISALPDPPYWEGARILDERGNQQRIEQLRAASDELANSVSSTLVPPRLNLPKYDLTQGPNGRSWQWLPNSSFRLAAPAEMKRFEDMGRLIGEMKLLADSPASESFRKLEERVNSDVDTWAGHLNGVWIGPLLDSHISTPSPSQLLNTKVGEGYGTLGDLGRGIRHRQANELVDKGFCTKTEYWEHSEQDGVNREGAPIMRLFPYQRFECYGYAADKTGGLRMGAQVDFLYRGSGLNNLPQSIYFFFEPPSSEGKDSFLQSVQMAAKFPSRTEWDGSMVRVKIK